MSTLKLIYVVLQAQLLSVSGVSPLRINGLIAAVVSPLSSDGLELNTSVVPLQAEV